MDSDQLRKSLAELGLSQADLARLMDLTPRAVALWMSGERGIPGPAAAYLRLFRLLPLNLRQTELNRLKTKGGSGMRDGMYGISFKGRHDAGKGMLVFDGGKVYGADEGGARYDGEYLFNETTGKADVRIKVTFPPNVRAVFGTANPYEWSIDVTTSLDPKLDAAPLRVQASFGQILEAEYFYLRPLPDAA